MTEEVPVQPRGRDPIPRDDLRELIEEWRETENVLEANEPEQYGREECADELEALLQE